MRSALVCPAYFGSVLASGALSPREAIDYVCKQRIESIVFGASSRGNIRQTVKLIEEAADRLAFLVWTLDMKN